MPKVHSVGPLFVQFTNFPYEWDGKFVTKGWTQEIEEPFRTSAPTIIRLPFYKALVFGRWSGTTTEEEALNVALGRRDLTEDDFTEEKGWVPAPDSHTEESLEDIYSRLDSMDGALDVHHWKIHYRMATEQQQPDA